MHSQKALFYVFHRKSKEIDKVILPKNTEFDFARA